jgi:hypothetical protein
MSTTNTTTTPAARYAAICTCGYRSAARLNPNDCVTLGEKHLIGKHPFGSDTYEVCETTTNNNTEEN